MKMLWNNFKVAFAMYSKIPMPRADWNKENMKYTFCFFPFIGLVIGALSYFAGWLGMSFYFNPTFISAILVLIPVFVTGGIHVDGLLDTSDALSSWQERERRLEILKDSHAGAFAVITASVYFLAWYGAYSQLWVNVAALKIMALGFMVSRCFSGISVMTFPKARKDGTVSRVFQKSRRDNSKKCSYCLSGNSFGNHGLDPAGIGKSLAFATAVSYFSLLSLQGSKIFWRDHRRSGRLFPLSLRGGNGYSAGCCFCMVLSL